MQSESLTDPAVGRTEVAMPAQCRVVDEGESLGMVARVFLDVVAGGFLEFGDVTYPYRACVGMSPLLDIAILHYCKQAQGAFARSGRHGY